MKKIAYDFGENWKDYSLHALKHNNIEQSMSDFKILMNNENISGKTFLDIGFGQGLSLLNATTLGAKTVGCDINPKCKEVLELNKQKYPALKDTTIPVVVGSITEKETVERIKTYNNKFDIVHSWAVLHHIGKL